MMNMTHRRPSRRTDRKQRAG